MTSISEQRYLIAQYTPDLRRMETKNIGVILWAAGMTSTHFLGDDAAEQIVEDIQIYRRWVAFWIRKAHGSQILLPHERPVLKSDPLFIDSLMQTQKGNYLLYDAGFVSDELKISEIQDAGAYLFNELVLAKKPATAEAADTLETIADRIVSEAGLTDRDDFHVKRRISCKVFGVEQELTFNYALDDESTTAVFQRVPMKQQSVTSAALMFHAMLESRKVAAKKRCAALVDIADDQREQPGVIKSLRMLRKVSEVIDMAQLPQAIDRVREIAAA